MTRWAHADVLDQGIKFIKDNATRILLVSDYAAGDSFATVIANQLGVATIATGDFVISTPETTSNRLLTFGGKDGLATATGTPVDAHLVFTNGTDKVLYATDEASEQPVTDENPITFPSLTVLAKQPTAPA